MDHNQAMPPQAVVMQFITGAWITQAVGAASRLGIADQLAAGPRTAEEIAAGCKSHAPSTARLLRMLSSVGVFAQDAQGRYALTPVGECLRSGVPGSMRELAIAETDHAHWTTWERFTDAVRTGRPMAREALQMDPWDYYAKHPEEGENFSAAMGNISSIAIPGVLAAYDFSYANLIVDVGGAHGHFLSAILKATPKAKGIVFDQPHVVQGAPAVLQAQGLADRATTSGGSFFERLPEGADAYVLKHILHDWNDDDCVRILKACRAACKPESRVVVVELVIPPNNAPSPAQLMDLNMMVMLGGMERTPDEFAALFQKAGLTLKRAVPTQGPFAVIEAFPA